MTKTCANPLCHLSYNRNSHSTMVRMHHRLLQKTHALHRQHRWDVQSRPNKRAVQRASVAKAR
jgi:hypothetical protein